MALFSSIMFLFTTKALKFSDYTLHCKVFLERIQNRQVQLFLDRIILHCFRSDSIDPFRVPPVSSFQELVYD